MFRYALALILLSGSAAAQTLGSPGNIPAPCDPVDRSVLLQPNTPTVIAASNVYRRSLTISVPPTGLWVNWIGAAQVSGLTPAFINAISRTGSIATATLANVVPGLIPPRSVTVSGVAGDTSFNGTFPTLSAAGNVVTYASAGTAGSGTIPAGNLATLAPVAVPGSHYLAPSSEPWTAYTDIVGYGPVSVVLPPSDSVRSVPVSAAECGFSPLGAH